MKKNMIKEMKREITIDNIKLDKLTTKYLTETKKI